MNEFKFFFNYIFCFRENNKIENYKFLKVNLFFLTHLSIMSYNGICSAETVNLLNSNLFVV